MTQVTKAGATHQRYDETFKQEALRLWQSSGGSAKTTALELGLSAHQLYRWKQELAPPPGAEPARPPNLADALAENAALRRENERLREQRDILKKAAGILCEPPGKSMPGSKL
jgi:transposase